MKDIKHQPERTCIGCRGVFKKDEVVRIVAGPSGAVIDYREKLPGRAAYVCPRRSCIESALAKDVLSRALRLKVKPAGVDAFLGALTVVVTEKVKSLIAMAAKSGKLAAGYSAVHDALEKGRANMVLYAEDLASGTREKVAVPGGSSVFETTLFTRDEFGKMLNRELVGVVSINDSNLADAVWKETKRLKSLININE
jgi:predicted RNA-binding protein YlxR (DUF448 family)